MVIYCLVVSSLKLKRIERGGEIKMLFSIKIFEDILTKREIWQNTVFFFPLWCKVNNYYLSFNRSVGEF